MNVNVNWPLAHYKVPRYLTRTLWTSRHWSTNWQVPSSALSKADFLPEHWSAQELEEWGKGGSLRKCLAKAHEIVSREVLAVALAAMGTFLVLGCGGGFGGAEGSSGGGLSTQA